MTNWLPNLDSRDSSQKLPLYIHIADQIEQDIDTGILKPGEKLPPQRNVAFDIGVTIGTISRAYALAMERGLVAGEVGRGTYVLDRESKLSQIETLTTDYHTSSEQVQSAVIRNAPILLNGSVAAFMDQQRPYSQYFSQIMEEFPCESLDYIRGVCPHWQEAGAQWLNNGEWRPNPATIMPSSGAHAGVLAAIAAVTVPGDRVVFEDLSYTSMMRGVSLIGRRPVACPLGPTGLDVEAFEKLCAHQHPKVVFLSPTLQNPTLAIMPEENRVKLVEIARRYNVWLVEDNIYGGNIADAPRTLAEIGPDRVFHVDGFSKTVDAGMRVGWVACPPNQVAKVFTAHKLLTGGRPFTLAELASRLVLNGDAQVVRQKTREEITRRHGLICDIFDGLEFNAHPQCPFVWLKLPEPWLSATFTKAAAEKGVLINQEDEFKVSRDSRARHRVRIAFSIPKSHKEVETGMKIIRSLIDSAPTGYDSYT